MMVMKEKNMNRREFLMGAAALAGGCATDGKVVNGFDENLRKMNI